ncbi:MAG: hypothetical protein DRQ48_03990 [Gammaproteobacteria bacterium]|nr:MAG: hypothetical protein DRQ58_04570 [Gammaproteobacteria bacterium]RKZ71313.1 MAG: hypothetical protein DRQ48_03990 [Gammaproteobacteria bacterium]
MPKIRKKHPKSSIEEALVYAESKGWRVEDGCRGHPWGRMYCPYNDRECRCGEYCITSIWGSPRSPENHAKKIKRVVDNCEPHNKQDDDNEYE